MKVHEVLNLNYATEEGRVMLNKVIKKVPAISELAEEVNRETVSMSCLERVLMEYTAGKPFKVISITPLYIPGEKPIYNATVVDNRNYRESWTVHSGSIYEMFIKLVILLYALLRKEGDVKK